MRIVALLPAGTDIVIALGAAESLVAVTHECDGLGSVDVPRVTRSAIDGAATPGEIDRQVRAVDARGEPLFALDESRIAELRPDVLITQAVCDVCAVREADVRALAARIAPSPRIVTLAASTLDGVLVDMVRVAEALDMREAGTRLLTELAARMRRVHETLKTAAAPRPRTAVIEWTDPVYAAGHWVPSMVHRAGGLDALARPGEHSRTVTVTEVAAAAPETLIFAPCGYNVGQAADEARRTLARPDWAWAARCRSWAIDANALVSRPGPRLIDGVETLARILHPALFPGPAAERAIEVSV